MSKNKILGEYERFLTFILLSLDMKQIICHSFLDNQLVIAGLRRASIKPVIIITMIIVRFMILPMIGILVIKTATSLGLLPSDPLFSFVLLIQYTVPPAMNISKQFLLCSGIIMVPMFYCTVATI
jgi:hypothetical protein